MELAFYTLHALCLFAHASILHQTFITEYGDFEVEELAFVGLEGKLSSTRRQDGRVSTRLISGIVRLRPYKRSGSFQKTDLVLSLFSENDTPSVQILKF